MPITVKIMPKPHTVAVLAYDGLCTFEFGCAVEVFGLHRPEMTHWYRFIVCAAERGPLTATGGIRVAAGAGLDALAQADTIVVPGWRDINEPPPPRVVHALREAHGRGARLVSICSGVFVLAATGLLTDKRATTHWRYARVLAERYPNIRVEPDVLYVDEGTVLTSAGSAAGLDLCLYIVRRDFGARIANQVARRLVMPPHREGGQAQFVERPVQDDARAPLAGLFDWIRRHLDGDLSIPALARRAQMSERTFMRRFRDATGTTPAAWIIGERLARARELLESTRWGVDRVASACGFGSADALRHHFRQRYHVSPARYRCRFAGDASRIAV
jgi:AraC family transcriptional regulator, transcriptional activator FtrA